MRRYLTIILVVFALIDVNAQQFQPKFELALSDTLTYEQVSWVDFDNDSLLDVLVLANDAESGNVFLIFKSAPEAAPAYQTFIPTSLSNVAYQLTDFDGDNQMDILVTGSGNGFGSTLVYFNRSQFVFESEILLNSSGNIIRYADVDSDGERELILGGGQQANEFVHVYKRDAQTWNVFDTLEIQATAIEVWDFNKDLLADLFVSGTGTEGKPGSWLYLSTGNYILKDTLVADVAGEAAVSDVNADGTLDIVVAGKNGGNNNSTTVVYPGTNCDRCFETEVLETLNNASVFLGDLNSDGKCDLNILGQTAASGDTLNLIWQSETDYDTIETKNVRHQAFGDFDRDGDLDLNQLILGNIQKLVLLENTTPVVNQGPGLPQITIAARVFNNIVLEWQAAEDDHTDSKSITYDVVIEESTNELVTGSFDLANSKRLTVSHGNAGTNNAFLVKSAGSSGFNFMVQSVDNAYHTGKNGICIGAGVSCSDLQTHRIFACHGEEISLAAPRGDGIWISHDRGILGSASSIQYTSDQTDTIFVVSRTRSESGCALIDAFIPEFRDTTKVINHHALYACEGTAVTFETNSGWEQVLWSSKVKGSISTAPSIVYSVTEADTLSLLQSDGEGCAVQENTPINISKPLLVVENDSYQILRGEQVQLMASGGGNYSWTPAETLDDATSGTPFARPWQTTTYVITVTDSIGCTASANVLVIVEENAFIPNLFTPNDDGKNDALKAFGLGNVKNFRFTIFNREGSLVFTTTNIGELVSRGWDGTSRGVKQPAGVYFWKVEGENNVGGNLALNGKNMGSIVLIR
jgi:gliding motility-associated-like protein